MYGPPPWSTRPDTPFPYTTPVRSLFDALRQARQLALTPHQPDVIAERCRRCHPLLRVVGNRVLGEQQVSQHSCIASAGGAVPRSSEPPQQPQATIGFVRSEEHTSELQSLMRISYAVFFLKKK